jgi:hypothetical protein
LLLFEDLIEMMNSLHLKRGELRRVGGACDGMEVAC